MLVGFRMQKEIVEDLRQQQILLTAINSKLKKKSHNITNYSQIYANTEKITNQIPNLQKRPIKKKSILLLGIILSLPALIFFAITTDTGIFVEEQDSLTSKYVTENLRGDTIDTWKFWNIIPGSALTVNIVNSELLDDDKILIIKNAITSYETILIDDSLVHKGPKGTSSTYYLGWTGSLKNAAELYPTKYPIPNNFDIIESKRGEGDIIILLSKLKDTDGYSGFTKSTVDGNEILKTSITIYDVNNLSESQLSTIILHEMGHAMGLAHSTAPEDLMYPVIETDFPYISECNISAIAALYNGEIQGQVVCEK